MKTLRQYRKQLGWFMTCLMGLSTPLQSLNAATVDWGVSQSGSPGTYTWQHLYNWNQTGLHLSPLLIPNAVGDIANLNLVNLSGNQTINLDGAVTLGTLNIGDASGQERYLIAAGTGGSLNINGAINKTGIGADVISASVTLGANTIVDVANGNLVLSGIVSGGNTLTKTGVGSLWLSGANTYTGATSLNAGTTFLGNANSLGTTAGGTTIASGATMALLGNNVTESAITLSGGGQNNRGAIRNYIAANTTVNGTHTLAGATRIMSDSATLTLQGTLTAANNDLTLGGLAAIVDEQTFTGSGDLTKIGLGQLTVRRTWAHTGDTNINGGILQLDANSATNFGQLSATSAININYGQLTVAGDVGANRNYAPTTATANRLADAAPITFNGGNLTLNIAGTAVTGNYAETMGAVTVSSGLATIDTFRHGFATGPANLATWTFGSLTIASGTTGATLNFAETLAELGAADNRQRILFTTNPTTTNGMIGAGVTVGNTDFAHYSATQGVIAFGQTGAPAYGTALTAGAGSTSVVRLAAATTAAAGTSSAFGLNLQAGTAFTLTIPSGSNVIVESGGLLMNGQAHTIAGPGTITAGNADPTNAYNLIINGAGNTGRIGAFITDNGGNPVSVTKTGTLPLILEVANTYTGKTIINQGTVRDEFNDARVSIGSGALVLNGGIFESDTDFTRGLGTGAGQVSIQGGVTGFSTLARARAINIGGAAATLTWGSADFNPLVFELNNGGQMATILKNGLDLGGEQRYISTNNQISRLDGVISNGSLVMRGAGVTEINAANTYTGGTIVSTGTTWLRNPAATLGANVVGNDIQVASGATLRIDNPSNLGNLQRVVLFNDSATAAPLVTLGAAFGDMSSVNFAVAQTGLNGGTGVGNIHLSANNANWVAIGVEGNSVSTDLVGRAVAAAPSSLVWLGAGSRNATYTGTTLSPSTGIYRLGAGGLNMYGSGPSAGGGVLTIANSNVLTGANGVNVGAIGGTARANIGGTVYVPLAQNYSGVTNVGAGGRLVTGSAASLGSNNAVGIQGGELWIGASGLFGTTSTAYGTKNIALTAATGRINVLPIAGGQNGVVTVATLATGDGNTLRQLDTSIRSNHELRVTGTTSLVNGTQTGANWVVSLNDGFINLAGGVAKTGAGAAIGIEKTSDGDTGNLIVGGDNTTLTNGFRVTRGTLSLTNGGAAGTGALSLNLATNGGNAFVRLHNDAATTYALNGIQYAGTQATATARQIYAGPTTFGAVNSTNIVHTINGGVNYGGVADGAAAYFNGNEGHNFVINGGINLGTGAFSRGFRVDGTVVNLFGTLTPGSATGFTKAGRGSLVLNSANAAFALPTGIGLGHIILADDQALGTSTISITGGSGGLLASGTRTIANAINVTDTTTTVSHNIGGLDAGLKTFSGNISLGTGGASFLTSSTGGALSFTGIISGTTGALNINGGGTVTLSGVNTNAGGITINNNSTLIGLTSSATPFGVAANNLTIAQGTVKLTGSAGATNTTVGALTFSTANGRLNLDATAGGATTLTAASLANRGAAGATGTFVPQTGSLNTNEIITLTAAPSTLTGISNTNKILGPWLFTTTSGSNAAGDFAALATNNIVSATTAGVYTGNSGDLDTVTGNTQVFDATGTGGTLTANRSVYAFRTDSSIALGSFDLSVGNSTLSNLGFTSGGGIILNNGADVAGSGKLISNGNELVIYTDSAAVSSINSVISNVVQTAAGGNITKSGPGTLELGAVNNYTGATTVNLGTLKATAAGVMPVHGVGARISGTSLTLRSGAIFDTDGFNQTLGNLAGDVNSILRADNSTLTIGYNNADVIFSGQLDGNASTTIRKVGANTVRFDNVNAAAANTFGTVDIHSGVAEFKVENNSYTVTGNPIGSVISALPSSANVIIQGGTFRIRTQGDDTGAGQRIYAGNNVTVQAANSTIDFNRDGGGASQKLLVLNNLALNDSQNLLITGGNTYMTKFAGTTTLSGNPRIQTDTQLVLEGAISGSSTLNKGGNSDLTITNANPGWTGGLVVTGGTVLFGNRGEDSIKFPGPSNLTYNSTATAGTGDIVINTGSAIRINTSSNINAGQHLWVIGSQINNNSRLDLQADVPLSSLNLRSNGALGISLLLGQEQSVYTQPIDLGVFGSSGTGGLSAIGSTAISSTMAPGVGNVFRFYGSNAGTLNLVSQNQLSGTASVVVGLPNSVTMGASPPGNGTATIRLMGDSNYTGSTLITRGREVNQISNTLEVNGATSTSGYDVYGRLTLRGKGTLSTDGLTNSTPITLRPGANLRFNYEVQPTESIFASQSMGDEGLTNKWGDNQALTLNGSGFNIIGHNARPIQEVIGNLTIEAGASITLERSGNAATTLVMNNLARTGQATLSIRGTDGGSLGGSVTGNTQRLIVNGTNPWTRNASASGGTGMVSPWIYNFTNNSFVDYDPADGTGFTNVAFNVIHSVAGNPIVVAANDVAAINVDGTITNATENVWALRVSQGGSNTDITTALGTAPVINVGSGGIFFDNDGNNRTLIGTATNPINVAFPGEGIIWVDENTSDIFGSVAATNLTKAGAGNLRLNNATTISGTVQVNGGSLELRNAASLGTATSLTLSADFHNGFDAGQMPTLFLRNDAATTYAGTNVIIAENVFYSNINASRVGSTGTPTQTIASLDVKGSTLATGHTSNLEGTIVRFSTNNISDINIAGTTTLRGAGDISFEHSGGRTVFLTGALVSTGFTGSLIKTGGSTLVGVAASTMTNGVILNAGELQLRNASAFGTGLLTVNSGTVRTNVNTANLNFLTGGVTINGSTTFIQEQNQTVNYGAAASTNEFRVNNSPLLNFQVNSASNNFGVDINLNHKVVLNSDAIWRNDGPDVILTNVISGAGAFIRDRGQPVLLTSNAPNTYSGGTHLLGGFTRQVTATGNFGTGATNVYPGAAVIVNNTNNITGGISKFQSSTGSMAVLGINAVGLAAAPTTILPSANITSATGIGGVLALDGVTTLASLNLSTLYNGNWYLGAINGGGTYVGNAGTLTPSSGVYRLGGGGATLTLQPATAGADVLTGANRLDAGIPNARMGSGAVTLGTNLNNSYSGGTNVFRARDYGESFVQTTLNVQGGNMTGGVFRTPLGTGAVQIFGDLRFEGANGTLVNAAGSNYTSVVTHPGSRLWIDNNTAPNAALSEGRYDDTAPITLNGAQIYIRGTNGVNTVAQKETFGDLTVQRGSDLRVQKQGAGAPAPTGSAALAFPTITRSGSATLMITHTTGLLGAQTGAMGVHNTENVLFTTTAPNTANSMVDPWLVSRTDNQFLKYDATNGLQILTQTAAPGNYIAPIAANITLLDGGDLLLNDGTEILSVDSGAATLGTGFNANVWALRTNQNISNAAGEQNKITIRSGGLIGFGNITVAPDLNFVNGSDTPIEALIYSSAASLNLTGRITASQVTKFGTSILSINRDQTAFTGDWVVNGGVLQAQAHNALSTGQVILNGSRLSDGFSYDFTELRYNMDSRQADPYTWQGGKITAYDLNVIRNVFGGASDRIDVIPAIDARTTNAVAGTGQTGTLIVRVDNSRTELRSGALTLFDNYQLHVDANNFAAGSTVTYAPATINNGGSFDLLKTGDAVLALGDNSATFTGSRRFEVAEGAVRVLHNGAFGAAGTNAIITAGGAMEIAVSSFSPTATLTQTPDSIERWAVNDARGTGAYTFGDRVHFQVSTNLTGTRTIDLNGGSLMGYVPTDHDATAVIHTIGSGVTVNMLKDSFLGQPFPAGNISWMYDMGKLNGVDNLNPSNPALTGSYLQIDGNITGAFNLTKQGHDIIMLSGAANTFSSLTIRDGQIQTGRTNTLPSASNLTTTADGKLDLFGYDQVITSLNSVGTTVSGVAQADHGRITNSAFQNNKLEVTGAGIYGGNVEGNVTFKKSGSGVLQFTAVNEYRGGTEITGGTLSISQDRNLGAVPVNTDSNNITFDGGTLLATGSFTLQAARGVTLNAGGGTVEVAPTFTTQVNGIITGVGALSKTNTGLLQLNNIDNNYTGLTNVVAGTLQGGANDTFAPLSRHVVTGDTVSGTLALNTFNQTIGSLSSTGPTQANATVTLSGTLTVGADSTKDAIYAGAITGTGSSIFQVNGNGAVQTLSTVDNSAQAWNTAIANGVLNVADASKLGSGSVTIGISSVSGSDDLTGLNLQNTPTFANNITVANVNTVGSAFITSTGANSAVTGSVTLDRNIYSGAATGTQLSLEGTVGGNGTITVVDGGTVRLTSANTYGTGVTGTSGTTIPGGTIVRAGSVLLENNTAAGANIIAMGDTTSVLATPVDRATFSSILGTGTFNPNGDGTTAVSGGQNAAGTTGFGAFIGVNSTVDGNTYVSGDVGKRLLISGEEANPERNGIYSIVSVTGGTMNLVRVDDFETGNQMKYGAQVAVTNGTYAGQTMFQYEEQIVVRNELTQEPIRFRQDVVNPNLSVLQNVSGLTVANAININATNGSGTMTVGGSTAVTTGTGTFSGAVQLQNLQTAIAEVKAVTLTSSTSAGNGITFSNVINAADQVGVTADVLSVNKTGAGTVTLSNNGNNYLGTTTVSDGRLQVGDGGLTGTGSITGTGAVSVTGAGTTLATAPVLAGGSGTSTIAGATTIGTATNPGILAPGLTNSSTSNQSITFSNASGITVANSSQIQMSISTPTLDAANATVTAWLGSGTNLQTYLTANPSAVSVVNVAPTTYGDLDYVNLTAGGLSLGTRAAAGVGNGALVVQDNGFLGSTPASGDLFNLFDWISAMTGAFTLPGTTTAGGTYGDLDLPVLTGGLTWDVSALQSHGIIAIAVIPEPSRLMLLFFGLFGLFFRRRRND